jgi:hypothetical protein
MSERSVWWNEDRARQLIRFDGLQWGTITPTDIDGLIEYQNKLWVLFEAKYDDKDVPKGQRLAMERFIQNVKDANKHGIAMIVQHKVKDTRKDVFMKNCKVREIYTTENPMWKPINQNITALIMADMYITLWG